MEFAFSGIETEGHAFLGTRTFVSLAIGCRSNALVAGFSATKSTSLFYAFSLGGSSMV
jgi:hypothetical protein